VSAIVELDLPCPSATDGEIAAINLESMRRGAWARFVQDPRLPGVAEAVVDNERQRTSGSRVQTVERVQIVEKLCYQTSCRCADRAAIEFQRSQWDEWPKKPWNIIA